MLDTEKNATVRDAIPVSGVQGAVVRKVAVARQQRRPEVGREGRWQL